MFFWLGGHAQLYPTILSSPHDEEHHSICDLNDQYVAISKQYTKKAVNNTCERELRLFNKQTGAYLASKVYSHDHGNFTKIQFDPTNERVVYALYTERVNSSSMTSPRRTYLKRFERSGSTFLTTARKEVFFSNNNVADMVIAPNGDVLIGAGQSDGSVRINSYKYVSSSMSLINSYLAEGPGSISYVQSTITKIHPVSMDMKGNQFILAHNTGNFSSSGVKIIRYNYTTSITPIETYNQPGQRLFLQNSMDIWNRHCQNVALKPNGEILYLNNWDYSSGWQLVRLTGSTVSTGAAGQSHANLVTLDNGKTLIAEINAQNKYIIRQYSNANQFQHAHIPSPELSNLLSDKSEGLDYLATNGCDILACGEKVSSQSMQGGDDLYFELFDCDECTQNCCPTEFAMDVDCRSKKASASGLPSGATVTSTKWYYSQSQPTSNFGQLISSSSWFSTTVGVNNNGFYTIEVQMTLANGQTCTVSSTVEYSSKDCCQESGPTAISDVIPSANVTPNPEVLVTDCGTFNVPVVCEDDIQIRPNTDCIGEKYMLSLWDFNEVTCSKGGLAHTTGIQSGTIPNTFNLSGMLPAGYYWMEFAVGTGWDFEYTIVRVVPCEPLPKPRRSFNDENSRIHDISLSLAPNPAQDRVTISFNQTTSGKISIVSTDGKQLQHQAFDNSQSVELNTTGLPSGLYYVHATIDGQQVIEKLMIK